MSIRPGYQTGSSGGGAWGEITGTLSNQSDLQTALDTKVDENASITGATKTKITYDTKGLVTSGADATTADFADSSNRRYVTDAQSTVLGNTSGTNTGDQSATPISVAQNTHGFAVGDVIKSSGSANAYAKAQADSVADAEVVGIVTTVTDANNFIYTTQGIITAGVPTDTAGVLYYLSPTSAGGLTSTEPSTNGQVIKPVLVILQSATRALFVNYRGMLINAAIAGTYTPTLTGVANVGASTAYVCQYMRVGSVVTVSGQVDIDPTTGVSTTTQLGISLPVASSLSATTQVAGTCCSPSIVAQSGGIYADATNDRAQLDFKAADPNNTIWYFNFTYLVV